MSGRARCLWAALAGGLHALALVPVTPGLYAGAPTTSLWMLLPALLQVLALVGLVHLLSGLRRAWAGAALGFVFGLCWFTGSIWWLFISLHRYGGLPAWLAALAVLALAGVLALFFAGAGAAWVRWRGGHAGTRVLTFAALWCLAEWARATWFTGFPWAASGYAHIDGPLAGWAPYLGVYGIGAMAAALAVCVEQTLGRGLQRRARLRAGGWALALVAVPLLLPAQFTSPGATLSVVLLQGNVPQDEKFEEHFLYQALSWHVQALGRAEADLVIAPETAIPLLPLQLPEGLWAALERRFSEGRSHALIGMPQGNERDGYTNSAMGLGPGLPPYRYDKHHLVPFGEFIPFGFRWFVNLMNIPLGDFDRGPLAAPSWPILGARVAPNICYEDLYGEELAARFVDPATAPTLLANLSNIGWFGNTEAVGQHLQISRMRSLELQRPMVRATNTGATVVIDHRGVVQAALAPHTQGMLRAQVQGRQGNTPFAWWAGRWGLWPLVMLALLVLVVSARLGRR
jgi:apolipoprotein N-acyltransferase